MKVIVGDTRSLEKVERLRALGWGRMWVGAAIVPYEGEPWGFDNGAYGAWKRRERWDGAAYLRQLHRAYALGTAPYLAVTPDIVAAGERSLNFSLAWLDDLPPEWPWYLAVQDRMTTALVKPHLHKFAGIFLGGSDTYKATAYAWRKFAHEHGKPFHYGRAGVLWKVDHAVEVGSDSIDSAFPLWTKQRFNDFEERIRKGNPQLRIEDATGY